MKESMVIDKNINEREIFFEALYVKIFPTVARFISKKGGSFHDAKDIFHDALVIFYEKSKDPSFHIKVSDEAYIVGITKHLWIRKFRSNINKVDIDHIRTEIPDDYFPVPSTWRLLQIIELTGKKCLEILQAFYYENAPLTAIAQKFNFSTTRSATVQKFKCLEKVRDKIKEKSLIYEDITE